MSVRRMLLAGGLLALGIGREMIAADEPSGRWTASNTRTPAVAEVPPQVSNLQQRIDQLEQENRLLRQSFAPPGPTRSSGLQLVGSELFPVPDVPPSSEPPPPPTSSTAPPADPMPQGLQFPPPSFESGQPISSSIAPSSTPGDTAWRTHWNHGIEWVSPDKIFTVHIGGRIQFDSVLMHEHGDSLIDAGGAAGPKDENAMTFRRARFRADGTMYEMIDYAVEFDFVNSVNRNEGLAPNNEANTINVPAPTDVWMNFRDTLFGANLRVGNMKEPFGFEHNASSRWLNFLERSPLQDLYAGPFNNGFTPGIMLFNTWDEEYGTWWLGVFKNNYFNVFGYDVGDGEYAATGRVTYTPLYCKDCRQVLHFGLAGSVRNPDQDEVRYRTRSLRNGPANLATVFADTGRFRSDAQSLLGLEVVGVFGPWSVAAEWMGSWDSDAETLAGASLGTVFTNGCYVEVLYFLTGESREYNRKTAAFDRVIPNQNFSWKNCCIEPGAWQLAARYAAADLRDGAINGGLFQELTLGVNWFLNPNTKVQWNYALTERDTATVTDGYAHGFGARLAFDF